MIRHTNIILKKVLTDWKEICKLMDGKWNQKFGISFSRNLRKYKFDVTPNNPAESRSNYDGKRIKFDWQNNFQINS